MTITRIVEEILDGRALGATANTSLFSTNVPNSANCAVSNLTATFNSDHMNLL